MSMNAAKAKPCTSCGEVKTLEDFCRAKNLNGGRYTRCKQCERKRVAKWRIDNPEKAREASRNLNHRQHMYGVSRQQYAELLAAQGGVCAVCRKKCSTGTTLSLDHDHTTKVVRGLLCRKCNFAIGLLDDSPELLEAARRYLAR